ncbi:adaptin N terminal region-domain-containing protein [Gongronella butleri]|nr:adaptin N terminal region-domain-containing protein [Gongronella butleri]
MNRPKFFTTNKKGENYELKAELNSEYRHVRKDAVKKVIANMTVGKDVSGLFPDVLKNMQTEDLELKKLVYLYLMNYAKSQPELVILAVNTFVKDSDDPNPLIRALAIRTMGCLRVDKIIDYLTEPLRKCLKDENPYVRKTAAICVAKLYELTPELTVEQDFVNEVKELVSDINPMVVANAVIALQDIHELSATKDVFIINQSVLNKLLNALNECTEWGQVAILTAMADYKATSSKEAEGLCERVLPRLQHANGAVVLAVVKVLMINMQHVADKNTTKVLCRKMAPPLVTLLSSPPEVQYIALRNINLVLQRRPEVLSNEIRVFFTKYNDPPYVKMEKLEIMIRLCNDRNVDQLLSELKEYANEVDVDFVRKSVNAIGRCAIKIEEAAERCINVLLDLINTGVSYVVQEAIVVIKDIFRKYPHTYEGIIPTLCENLEALDEPQARASLIWIIGEYAERIDNADDLINTFLENFMDENIQPNENQDLVQRVLQTATTECDNADIRDRAYVYWRLLSTDPQAAKAVVLSDKPPVHGESNSLSAGLLDSLLSQVGTLASVYHKPPETFIAGRKYGADNVQATVHDPTNDEYDATAPPAKIQEALRNNDIDNLLDLDWDEPSAAAAALNAGQGVPSTSDAAGSLGDLMSLDATVPTSPASPASTSTMSPSQSLGDIMQLYNNGSASSTPPPAMNHNNMAVGMPFGSAAPAAASSSSMNDLFDFNMPTTTTTPPPQQHHQPSQPQKQGNGTPNDDPFAGLF